MDDCLIPIVIGVTGHLDLKDEKTIENAVEAIITRIKNGYPNTPIRILSTLAEGADRLVARIGISLGVKLWTVLPMPEKYYKDDFDEASKNEFDMLFHQKEAVFELPLLPNNTPENIQGFNSPRNSQYAAAGAYIAAHSNILLAIWNGTDTGQEGGTADIVRFQLEGTPQKYAEPGNLIEAVDNGPVYYIFAPRSKKQIEIISKPKIIAVDCMVESNEKWDVLYPSGWKHGDKNDAGRYYARTLKAIDDLNKDIKNKGLLNPGASQKYKEFLFEGLKAVDVANIEKTLSSGMGKLFNVYAIMDCLAGLNQSVTVKRMRNIILIAFSAFIVWSLYGAIFAQTFFLFLFIFLLLIAFMMKKKADKDEAESKYYDYRVLAEGLRTQFYWKYLGLKENVHESYSSKYRGEIGLIQHTLKISSMAVNLEIMQSSPSPLSAEKIEFVKKHWIEGQVGYFKSSILKRQKIVNANSKYTSKLIVCCWIVAIFAFVALKVIAILKDPSNANILSMDDVKNSRIYQFLEVCFDLVVGGTASWVTFLQIRGTENELKQFQRMNIIFSQSLILLVRCLKDKDFEKAGQVLIKMGREAITENGDWLLMQRSRPLEVPLG